jgi:hypothetical protein
MNIEKLTLATFLMVFFFLLPLTACDSKTEETLAMKKSEETLVVKMERLSKELTSMETKVEGNIDNCDGLARIIPEYAQVFDAFYGEIITKQDNGELSKYASTDDGRQIFNVVNNRLHKSLVIATKMSMNCSDNANYSNMEKKYERELTRTGFLKTTFFNLKQ